MNNTITIKNICLTALLAACAACGSGLQLSKPQATSTATAETAASAANAAAPSSSNNANPVGAGANGSVAQLKCRQGEINGGYIAYCSCSTEGGKTCPVYNSANDSNAAAADQNQVSDTNSLAAVTSGSHTFTCSTQAVAGGYIYTCNCSETRNPGDTSPGCPSFFNPADPNAQPPTSSPKTSCQSQVYQGVGSDTTCTCTDSTDTGPCTFYQGNSYTTSSMPYQEVCSSEITATGVITSCSCDMYQQPNNAACPSTFDPANNVQPWD